MMAESIVYFMKRQSDGAIKIGTTTNIKTRAYELKTIYGDMKLLGAIIGGRSKERELHNTFAQNRLDGEFFEENQKLTALIANFAKHPKDIIDIDGDNIRVTFVTTKANKARLEAIAARERRTLSSQIDYMLEQLLKDTGVSAAPHADNGGAA